MSRLDANALGEVLAPGRVPDCYLGLRLDPAVDAKEAGVVVVVVAPAVLHPVVPQPSAAPRACRAHRAGEVRPGRHHASPNVVRQRRGDEVTSRAAAPPSRRANKAVITEDEPHPPAELAASPPGQPGRWGIDEVQVDARVGAHADLTGNTTHTGNTTTLRALQRCGPPRALAEQTNGPGIGGDRAGAVRLPPAWRRVALDRALRGRQALHRSGRRRIDAAVADPYRWQRSLEVLDGDGVPVHEFFQNAAPMGPATARAY